MNNDILLQEFGKSLYDFNAYLKNITSSESFSREELESLKGLQRAVMICARRYYNAIDVSPEIIKLINTDDIKKFKDNLKELINKTTSDIKANKNTLQNKHKLHSLLKAATMIANESKGSLLQQFPIVSVHDIISTT